MVINRDRHNKYSVDGYLSYSNTDSTTTTTQGTTDSSQQSSGSTGGGGGSTTIIYQGGSSKPAFNQVNVGQNAIVATNDLTAFGIAGSGKIQVSLENNVITITYVEDEPTDQYWQVDEEGNLYTTRNVYSTQEISAYGLGEGGIPTGGASYLHELKDVDLSSLADQSILQYNSTTQKWEATDGSTIKPDLSDYATIAYVDNKVNGLSSTINAISQRVTNLEDMFEWDGDRIKAKADLYGVGEISAYGYAEGEIPTGAQYLSELKDVDLTNIADQGILQYNSNTRKWEVTDGSSIRPDLTGYATQSWVTSTLSSYATQAWVTTQISNLIGTAPDVLDTIYEIAAALNNDPDFVKDIANNLANLTNRVTVNETDIAALETNLDALTNRVVSLEDMFEWDGTKIKAKADLYGVGEISAYGYSEGETPTGAQYLHELKDVTLTDITSGQLLQWNGSKWVNINKDEVGLNESELANYLTENNYVTESYITWDNISNKPSSYQTEITKITGLNSSWIDLLKVAPTDYVTRWPTAAEVGALTQNTADSRYALTTGTNATGTWGINISGNASTADKWRNERVFALSGAVTGSITIDGSEDVTLVTTYSDGNIGVLDNRYVNISGDTMTGELVAPTVKANTRVQIGDAYLVYESSTKAIKVCYKDDTALVNLYATGEVSAYDFDGEATGFSVSLSDLTDVSLTDITSGQLLQWNGTKWVNIDKNEVGLNESQLAEYLTDNQYAKKSDISIAGLTDLHSSWDALLKAAKPATLAGYGITDAYTKTDADGRYVLKTGDMMTGTLRVRSASNPYGALLTGDSTYGFLQFGDMTDPDGTHKGIICGHSGRNLSSLSVRGSTNNVLDVNGNVVLNAANYASTLDSRYVKKSGDTMTGRLYWSMNGVASSIGSDNGSLTHYRTNASIGHFFDKDVYVQGEFYAGSNYNQKVWHAGNDGSGSGLDADLLDGYHSTSFSKRSNINIEVKTTVNVEDFAKNTALTGEAGTMLSVTGWAWSNSAYIKLNDSYTVDRMRYSILSYRNGSVNNVWNQQALMFLPTYHENKEIYLVQMNTDDTAGVVSTHVKRYTDYDTILASNVASATKLRTARTIWGQSFDGTANVTGSLTGVLDITSDRFYLRGSTTNPLLRVSNTNATGYFQLSSAGDLSMDYGMSSGKNITMLKSNGYVGIGTTSPTARLHVAGDAYASGYFKTDGWFQNNVNGCGLYNSAQNARWYAQGGCWNTDKPIIPKTNNTQSVGTSSYRFNYGYFTNLNLSGGLAVSGTSTFNGQVVFNNNSLFNNTPIIQSGAAWIYYGDSSYSKGRIGYDSSTNYFWIQGIASNGHIHLSGRNDSVLENITLKATDVDAHQNFTASGNITAYGEVTAYYSSDKRLKENIQKLTALDTIRNLQPVSFDWTEEALTIRHKQIKHDYGLIAQEVEEYLPDIVGHDMYRKGYLGIDYTKLIPFALAGIKEVDSEVTKLKQRVEQLEQRLSKYESIV